jgi:hypothetical protein
VGMFRPENGSEFESYDDVRLVSNFCRVREKMATSRHRRTCHDRCHVRAIPAPENDPHHRRVEPLMSVPCDWLRRLAAHSCLHFDGPCVSPPSHPRPDDVNLASVRRRPSAWLRR